MPFLLAWTPLVGVVCCDCHSSSPSTALMFFCVFLITQQVRYSQLQRAMHTEGRRCINNLFMMFKDEHALQVDGFRVNGADKRWWQSSACQKGREATCNTVSVGRHCSVRLHDR